MTNDSKENLIDSLQEAGMLYFVLGSLICADSLTDVESCRKALKMSEGLKADFVTSTLKDDLKIKSLLEKANAIIKRDLQIYLKKKSTKSN